MFPSTVSTSSGEASATTVPFHKARGIVRFLSPGLGCILESHGSSALSRSNRYPHNCTGRLHG
jgi:hypothetical protein